MHVIANNDISGQENLDLLNLSRSSDANEPELELSQTFSQNATISEDTNSNLDHRSVHNAGFSEDANMDSQTNTVSSKYLFLIKAKAGLMRCKFIYRFDATQI